MPVCKIWSSMHLKYSVFFQALTVNAHDNCFHAGEQWNNILILTLKERLVTEKRDFNYFLKKTVEGNNAICRMVISNTVTFHSKYIIIKIK